jgi:hypothetical protein
MRADEGPSKEAGGNEAMRQTLALIALLLISCHETDKARALCVKMCEPRLVHRFDSEIESCECNETDFNLPPRCEATCLPRLVKSWNRNTGSCECQDQTTWGMGIYDSQRIQDRYDALMKLDAGPQVDEDYHRMVEAGAPPSLMYPSNFGHGEPPHPHTPETP